MSVPSKQGNRAGERNRSKFRAAGDVSINASKGSGTNQQKLSAGRYQHGTQISRKAVRHMPPPVNLPSLKAENARLGLEIVTTTPELSGCEQTSKTNQTVSGQNSFFSSVEQSGFPTQKSNGTKGREGQASPADYGQHMRRSGTLADQKLRRFQEDFPQLSSVVEGPVVVSKSEDRSLHSSYGPGPSLRPQNVSTWREGGGSGILQTSPPVSPLNQAASVVGSDSVASAGNLSSATEGVNIGTSAGTSRDEVTRQDDGRSCQDVQRVAVSANNQVPVHLAVRPGLQSGVNKWMEVQTQAQAIPYPGMMMPPYGFGPGFGHPPYSAGLMFPVMPRMPLMNPLNAGFHAFQPPGDKAVWVPSDTIDKFEYMEAFKKMTLSGPGDLNSRSGKPGYDERSAGEVSYGQHLNEKLSGEDLQATDYKFNKSAGSVSSESDEIFGQKNQTILTNGMKSSHGVARSFSNSETSDTQQSRNYEDGHLPLRSISNPSSSEELEDSLQHRRKQQSELMLAAVERARRRREEEERQLKEKQMAAAREKLRQLEEKLGKKPSKESKTSDTESCGSECSKPQDGGGKRSRPSTVVDNEEDVRVLDVELSPSVNEGYYAKTPYSTQPEHLHRLPSPRCWSENASNARMAFPPFPPVDPYFYWRHYIESGGGMPFYPGMPGMRMPLVPAPSDFPVFKGGNNVAYTARPENGQKLSAAELVSPKFGMTGKTDRMAVENDATPAPIRGKSSQVEDNSKPDECLSDSHEWNAFNSYWVQPNWMKYGNDGFKSGSSVDKSSRNVENHSGSMKSGSVMQEQSHHSTGHAIDPRNPQLYYQVWWNFNPLGKINGADSSANALDNYSNSDPLSKIEQPGMANPFNKSISDRYHSAIDTDHGIQNKYTSHKLPSKGKSLDTFGTGHASARDLEFEQVDNQAYSAVKRNTASVTNDPFSGASSMNQKIKVVDKRPQIGLVDPCQDDCFQRQSPKSHLSKSNRDALGNQQADQRRVKNYDDVSKSRNFHEKSNTGSLKRGNFKSGNRTGLIEDVFWERSASKNMANGLVESPEENKLAVRQSEVEAGNDGGENGWERSKYGEYRGYY